MNKFELVSAVAEEVGMSKKDTGIVVDKVIEAITAALAKGGDSAVSKLTVSSGNQIPFDTKKIGTITVVVKK